MDALQSALLSERDALREQLALEKQLLDEARVQRTKVRAPQRRRRKTGNAHAQVGEQKEQL